MCLLVCLHKRISTPSRCFHQQLLFWMPNHSFWSQTKCLMLESPKTQNLGDWKKNTWVIWHPVYSCLWKINVYYFQSLQCFYSLETATSWKTVCTTVSLWEDSVTESSDYFLLLFFFPFSKPYTCYVWSVQQVLVKVCLESQLPSHSDRVCSLLSCTIRFSSHQDQGEKKFSMSKL